MKDFKYIIDTFADIKIIRFQVPKFQNLTIKEKEYVYYLSEAAKWGRDITWLQLGKNNLIIRKVLETIINNYKNDDVNEQYNQFLVYAKRVFFSNDIHHHYGKHKFFPECSKKYFEYLMDFCQKKFSFESSYENFKKYIIDLIYEDDKKSGDILLDSRTDFYEGINEKEAKEYYDCSNYSKPVAYGLNSKLVKEDNMLIEKIYKIGGLYSKYIEKIIEYLTKALNVAGNSHQEEYTKLLIEYYKTGDLKLWDDYNISWVKDNDSNIDYISGFIEVYDDPISIKGTWEALVDMIDIETTKITSIIANNAQWFEDNSPIDSRFKKEKVLGIKAKAINAITLSGSSYPSSPIGINLPNSDWIREEYGSKSVSITNLTDAYDKSSLELPKSIMEEFSFSKEEIQLEKKYIDKADNLHTHLHECLGHGSGRILKGVSSNSLGEFQSTLEEARADIFSLYYMADSKLIELGITDDLEMFKAYYNFYIRNGLQTQLVRIELGKNIVESHMQARKLIATWSYEKGKKENIIEKKIKDNKTYFIVNDFVKLRDIFKELLIELQRIKSTGDYQSGKNLVLKYGIEVDKELHKEVLERYKKLDLKPYSGFVNPDIVPVYKDGLITDYKLLYVESFLDQSLNYGKNYSF